MKVFFVFLVVLFSGARAHKVATGVRSSALAPRATLRTAPQGGLWARFARPRFDGWCCRCTDDAGRAASVIVGVFKRRQREEHLAALVVRNDSGTFAAQRLFSSSSSTGGDPLPTLTRDAWSHPDVGSVRWGVSTTPSFFAADLAIDGVAATVAVHHHHHGVDDDDATFLAEGWLGRRPFRYALPCRYLVPATRAACDVALGRTPSAQTGGLAHVEFNTGRAFPSGWVWCQAHDVATRASLIVVAGPFLPSLASKKPTVLAAARLAAREDDEEEDFAVLELRTVDRRTRLEAFATCVVDDDALLAVRLVTTTRRGGSELVCDLRVTAPVSSFVEPPLYVPTRHGFRPGARESFDATAHLRIGTSRERLVRFDGATLEFGGDYISDVLGRRP